MPTESLTISTTTNRVSGWTYDAAGNVTNDGTHTYAYDAENRLIKVDNGSTATYAYGPKGERVWKIAGGVTTFYYWGIGEKVSGSWTKFFVSGLGGKLVEYTSTTTEFYVTNHLGSVAARMSLSGSLSETYRFLPFGERYAGTATTHQFTGKERDQESGLDYFGARYLASNHGRWMSVDPELGDTTNPQRLNRYVYVLNNPTHYLDPNGKQEQAIDDSGDMTGCEFDFSLGKWTCQGSITVHGGLYGQLWVVSRPAFGGIPGTSHVYIWSPDTGFGIGTNGSSGGDPAIEDVLDGTIVWTVDLPAGTMPDEVMGAVSAWEGWNAPDYNPTNTTFVFGTIGTGFSFYPPNNCHTQACGALNSIGIDCPSQFGDGLVVFDDLYNEYGGSVFPTP